MRPVVGITSYVEDASWGAWNTQAAIVPMTYVRAVEHAGGRAVILPPTTDGVEETLDALDGIIFSGGADIDPARYGATRHPETTGMRPDRDRAEEALLEAAMKAGIPVLAICRGMQLLNVVRGGTLHQHLPEDDADPEHRRKLGEFGRHDVDILDGTRLGGVLGDRAMVASHHHQAPDSLGDGLRTAAKAPDGTIEGIEDPGDNFVVGVLWHPEEGEDRALFEALVKEASNRRRATE
jgi:gamma-glutamyl-gamma-aminobutyrate hydrolase PuuD